MHAGITTLLTVDCMMLGLCLVEPSTCLGQDHRIMLAVIKLSYGQFSSLAGLLNQPRTYCSEV